MMPLDPASLRLIIVALVVGLITTQAWLWMTSRRAERAERWVRLIATALGNVNLAGPTAAHDKTAATLLTAVLREMGAGK